ncbi:hypothetical protein BHE74_00009239 [Ensete ventricosum]|nr:hypothetical protein BHE74_00009239 [Ensete ventricosum]RZR80939.1 hypothetical protein BHM03_00007049 [Ensete ventricosum]
MDSVAWDAKNGDLPSSTLALMRSTQNALQHRRRRSLGFKTKQKKNKRNEKVASETLCQASERRGRPRSVYQNGRVNRYSPPAGRHDPDIGRRDLDTPDLKPPVDLRLAAFLLFFGHVSAPTMDDLCFDNPPSLDIYIVWGRGHEMDRKKKTNDIYAPTAPYDSFPSEPLETYSRCQLHIKMDPKSKDMIEGVTAVNYTSLGDQKRRPSRLQGLRDW